MPRRLPGDDRYGRVIGRGQRMMHQSTVKRQAPMVLRGPADGRGDAGRSGPGACGPFASPLASAWRCRPRTVQQFNAPERVLGVTGRNGVGTSFLGEDPRLVRAAGVAVGEPPGLHDEVVLVGDGRQADAWPGVGGHDVPVTARQDVRVPPMAAAASCGPAAKAGSRLSWEAPTVGARRMISLAWVMMAAGLQQVLAGGQVVRCGRKVPDGWVRARSRTGRNGRRLSLAGARASLAATTGVPASHSGTGECLGSWGRSASNRAVVAAMRLSW